MKAGAKSAADREKEEANAIARKLDEIKNAEKQVKITKKELASLQRKFDKVKDWEYLTSLFNQCEEDKASIEKLEKENRKLAAEQRKYELRHAKKAQPKQPSQTFPEGEQASEELQNLENEHRQLRHKLEYLQEKLVKEQEQEDAQIRNLEMLRGQIKQGTADEQRLIQQAKNVYNIDFENVDKQVKA